METNDIYRLADDALKFIDTIAIESVSRDDEIVLAMALNKATQLKYATFRIQELLTQFEEYYAILVNNPDKYKIMTNTGNEDTDYDQIRNVTS